MVSSPKSSLCVPFLILYYLLTFVQAAQVTEILNKTDFSHRNTLFPLWKFLAFFFHFFTTTTQIKIKTETEFHFTQAGVSLMRAMKELLYDDIMIYNIQPVEAQLF